MIEASQAWKDIQNSFLLPETYVEIDCTISAVGAEKGATVRGDYEAKFSNVASTITDAYNPVGYATNELNLWSLNGTKTILPSSAPYDSMGYVSDIASTGGVTLSFPATHYVTSSGLTITWSNVYGEYPAIFTVTAKQGDTVIAEQTTVDNRTQTSVVFLDIIDCDSITITVHDWGLPYRRVRIEKIIIGHVLTLTKNDIISFKHEQHGDLLSGGMPKSSIEFTLNNIDGRWNPNNPTGMERYLSERQKLVVRYGMVVNGSVEWIKGGVFWLSEWDAPSNGYEARFVARDSLEFMMGQEVRDNVSGTLTNLVRAVAPVDVAVVVDSSLSNYSSTYTPEPEKYLYASELVQMISNAGLSIMRYDRDGVLNIEPLRTIPSGYTITSALSYTHPEVILAKPLRSISVEYGAETPFELSVSNVGETQTVSNPLVVDQTRASQIAEWVREVLTARKTVSGEFRADPRLDLFDVVVVESKYGRLEPVVITNITYTYNGSFRGSYTGRILEGI